MTLAASAQTVYDNGPINGETDAFTINFGFIVSNSFTVSQPSQITGLSFGAWTFPGDVLESVDVSITSEENEGTLYFNQQVNFTQSNCFANNFGFNVCTETGSFNAGNFIDGTYWINLQNAVVNTGDPIYWDENSGVGCTSPGCPSQASQNDVNGSIPSEAFTILGTSSSSGTGSVPEPGSLLLFAGGFMGVAGMLRRKLR
jgi:PEP-CTERM motif